MNNNIIYSVLNSKEIGVCCSNVCSSCSWNQTTINIFTDKYGNTSFSNQWFGEVGGWYYQREFSFNFPNPPQPGTWTNLSWQPGYPDALSGTLYAWTKESHYYMERVGDYGFYKVAQKYKYRLYQCQNGAAVDITSQACNAGDKVQDCYAGNNAPGDPPLGQISLGTTLDWQFTTDDSKSTSDNQSECVTGYISATWNANTPILTVVPAASNLLSCTLRTCTNIPKTECEAGGGIWQPGLTCAEVNCN